MGAGPTPTTQALRMRDSSMFYFNISINYCAGCKYSPHPWLALGARRYRDGARLGYNV